MFCFDDNTKTTNNYKTTSAQQKTKVTTSRASYDSFHSHGKFLDFFPGNKELPPST